MPESRTGTRRVPKIEDPREGDAPACSLNKRPAKLLPPSLVLLAGGASRRMGRPKALLPVPPHNVPLLVHLVTRIRRAMALERIVLVANEPDVARVLTTVPDVCVVPDRIAGQGPLRGLATGLAHIADWAIVLGCDMPFVKPAVLQYLLACRGPSGPAAIQAGPQAVIPVIHSQAQPLHAVYHVSCLPAIGQALDAGARRMTAFWSAIRLHTVSAAALEHLDPQQESFQNLNTPADWQAARAKLARQSAPV